MNLKEYISNKENNALELVRCGSCQNALIHCGKYEIVQLGQIEGVLCETCKKSDRKLRIASKVSDDGKRISQITVQELLLEPQQIQQKQQQQQIQQPPNNNNKKQEKNSK